MVTYEDIVLFISVCFSATENFSSIFSIGYLRNDRDKFFIIDHNENEKILEDILPENDTINFLTSSYNDKYKINVDKLSTDLDVDGYQVVNTQLKDIFQVIEAGYGYNIYIY